MELRILATGSRAHPFPDKVFKIIEVFTSYAEAAHLWKREVVWVNGDCPTKSSDAKNGKESVDKIVQRYCNGYSDVRSEEHPADWDRFGLAAGPKRNTKMVKRGAIYCVGFPDKPSGGGTWNCINQAKAAGIPTIVFGLDDLEYVDQVKRMIDFVQKNKVKRDIVDIWKEKSVVSKR